MANIVVCSFDSPAGDHCVDIFMRDDGTYGVEEFRNDPEDLKGWFPLHRHSGKIFATDAEALTYARNSVAWMAGVPSRTRARNPRR